MIETITRILVNFFDLDGVSIRVDLNPALTEECNTFMYDVKDNKGKVLHTFALSEMIEDFRTEPGMSREEVAALVVKCLIDSIEEALNKA